MNRWIGRWLIGIGLLHSVYALADFADPLAGMLRDGLFDAVETVPGRPLAFWFLLFGLLLIPVGLLVDRVEAQSMVVLPPGFAYGLLGVTVLGCVAMPVSGFWLLLPPALGAIHRSRVRTTARG